jgi:hypothetical protein
MATATTNILINSISGRIGNVVFYTNRGRQCVRKHVIPRNPDTEAQRIVRRAFGDAVRSWQAMTQDEKHEYIRKARYLNMSGYNLYISTYMKIQILMRQPEDTLNQHTTLSRASAGRGWPAVRPGRVRAPEKALASLSLLPVPERSRTLPERIPSVSESYTRLSGTNALLKSLKLRPG